MLHFVAWMVWILLFIITAAFTIPNMHLVTLNYYVASVELSVAVLLLLALSIGMLLGISLNLLRIWSLQRDNQRLKKLHKQNLHEINTLLAKAKQDTPH